MKIDTKTALGIAALAVLVFKARSASSAGRLDLASIMVWSYLDETRANNVRIIQREFNNAGYDDIAAAAAVVNAIAESGLNAGAIGDGGASVGLFQLHENGGGAGMSVEERTDPVLNTQRIILETQRGQGLKFLEDYKAGKGFLDLVYSFCVNVERPADRDKRGLERVNKARDVFPSLSNVS